MLSTPDCFLCDIPSDLVFAESDGSFALCGLGPVTPGYTVVGTRSHIASATDAVDADPTFIHFAERVRAFLGRQFGDCLLTEHGRMPVCVGPMGPNDPHCFHAHFLMFPGAPPILQNAATYFAQEFQYPSIADALGRARELEEYMLISPSSSEASILVRPGRMIPQFARFLVAEAIGRPERTNWKKDARRSEAVEMADILRSKWKEPTQ